MDAQRSLVALSLSTLLVGGCATARRGSFSENFVNPGESSVASHGKPEPAPSLRGAVTAPATNASPPASRPVENFGSTIEAADKRLSAALILEAVQPTAANHLQVAIEYRRIGILDAAADRLDLALKKSPRMAAAHELLARVWRDWGFPAQALTHAHRATYYAPHSASAQNTLGTILSVQGRFDDARTAYARALSLHPRAEWVLNNLCDLERRQWHLERARHYCAAALEVAPEFVAAHNNLGLVLAASGDLTGARQSFQGGGDSAGAFFNLGIVRLAEREYASAADAFIEAIRARPAFTAAKVRAHEARLKLLTGGK